MLARISSASARRSERRNSNWPLDEPLTNLSAASKTVRRYVAVGDEEGEDDEAPSAAAEEDEEEPPCAAAAGLKPCVAAPTAHAACKGAVPVCARDGRAHT